MPASSTRRGRVTVACLKFGSRYGPEYVNRFARAVRANLSLPHRVVCLTDDPTGVAPDVETRPIPDFGLPRENWFGKGNWPKIGLFHPDQFPDDEIVLYFDIDVLIIGALDPFARLVIDRGGFHHLREWNPTPLRLLPPSWRPDRGGQGSVLLFRAGEQRHVWGLFRADPFGIQARHRGDRDWWHGAVRDPHYLPYDWCVSFKRHCVWYWPFNLIFRKPAMPRGARLVVFHGKPDPADLLTDDPTRRWGSRRKFGYGGVDWVKDYWRRYAD